jgi:hypothetical protein
MKEVGKLRRWEGKMGQRIKSLSYSLLVIGFKDRGRTKIND